MKLFNLFLILVVFAFVFTGCGIANYAKSNQLKQEITAEKQKLTGLEKKVFSEQKKLQRIKDSVRRYNALLGVGNNGK